MAFCGLWHVPSLQMERKRIQNKIAESRWTLSTLTMLALAVWGLAGMGEHRLWINLLCLVLSTYLMVELNNANTLIRIYSRMVSGSFLVLATVCMHQLTSYTSSISILCMAGFYTSLFRSYQDAAAGVERTPFLRLATWPLTALCCCHGSPCRARRSGAYGLSFRPTGSVLSRL